MATFGLTTDYSTSTDAWNDQKIACQATLTENGDVTKLTAYIGNQASGYGACYVKAVIYADSGSNTPGDLEATGSAVSISSNAAKQWVDLSFASTVSLGAGSYWLGLIGDANADGIQFCNDNGSGGRHDWYADTYSDGPTDPWGAGHNARTNVLCVYATYSATAGSGLVPNKLLRTHLYPIDRSW